MALWPVKLARRLSAVRRDPSWTVATLSVVALILAAGGAGCGSSDSQGSAAGGGKRAADFDLTTLEGDPIRLSDYRGEVVLVDFWATWCGPCRLEVPHLIDLQNEYGPRGFRIVGVAISDREGNVREFARRMRLNYPVAMGNPEVVNDFGGFRAIPTKFLVAPDGTIATSFTGYQDRRVLARAIERLLPPAGGTS